MSQGMAYPPVYQPVVSSLPNWNAKCVAGASRKAVFWGDSTTRRRGGLNPLCLWGMIFCAGKMVQAAASF